MRMKQSDPLPSLGGVFSLSIVQCQICLGCEKEGLDGIAALPPFDNSGSTFHLRGYQKALQFSSSYRATEVNVNRT